MGTRVHTPTSELDPAVIRQVSHDLGNLFHRSYHCIDSLAASLGATTEGAPELFETLAASIEETERRCRAVLRYVGPLEADVTSIAAGDLLDSFARYLEPFELVVEGPSRWDTTDLAVDCALAAAALSALAARFKEQAGASGRVVATVDVQAESLLIDLDVGTDVADAPDPELQLALVQRQLTAFAAGFVSTGTSASRLFFARPTEGLS